jgi:serine protease Do
MEENNPFLFGVGLKDFTASSPAHGDIQGVLVVGVDEDTNAWNSDMRPGDVITSANQKKVISVAELKAVATKADKTLLLNVLRGPTAVFLVINKEQ